MYNTTRFGIILLEMAGKSILPDGTVAVRATAKFLKVDPNKA